MTLHKTSQRLFELRTHRPGDMGLITYRHGLLYNKEPYGWGPRFEALVARITADFIDNYKPEKERCWIAENNGEFLGCVMLVQDPEIPEVGKLRLLLVEEASRGMGLGTNLIQECIKFAREAKYKSVILWTQSILEGARRLYKQAGFNLVESEEHESFGHHLTGEMWRLNL
ncbi:putative HTH-type DNA-binding domain-containing acetyltransferase YbfA [Paramyrothecium foliicola]|nr:putative HTH-type DNA-binding domain-containing acetyltransferase YbfA [Paramyrothecium foliicola]